MYYRNNRWRNNYRRKKYRNNYSEPALAYLVNGLILLLGKALYFLITTTISLFGWIWGKIRGQKEVDVYSEFSEVSSASIPNVDEISETFKPILDKNIEVPKPRYFRKRSLLTPAEDNFYKVLNEIAKENNYIVQTKVRLEGLIGVNFYTENWFGLRNRIKSREMDFVLCKKEDSSLDAILVIELDDSSHSRQDRVKRDENLNAILQEAGLPILHVPAANSYDSVSLSAQIKEKIGE